MNDYLFNASQITLNDVEFNYYSYSVYIMSKEPIKVNQLDYEVPFFYSDKQEITIYEGDESYFFEFKTDLYKNDILFMYHGFSFIVLDKCNEIDNEVQCEIKKEELEANFVLTEANDNDYQLYSINDNYGVILYKQVLDIKINYYLYAKKDIYVSLTKLRNKISESGVAVAYETNITSIPNLKTNMFKMQFFDLLYSEYANGSCFLKKSDGDSLLFLCYIKGNGYLYILETEEEIVLNDINHKYNFIISPIELFDVTSLSDTGTEVLLTYPPVLNYTFDETVEIKYLMSYPYLSENIKLNPDSKSYLNCTNIDRIKSCVVPLSHFNGKNDSYYYTYHTNHLNTSSIYYDGTPIKVILPKDNIIVLKIYKKEVIKLGTKGTLYFEINYNDTEKNIFDISDIEELTKFETRFNDKENEYEYDAVCKLWKPINKNLRLFCNLERDLRYSKQNISFGSETIIYKNFSLVIIFEDDIEVNQYNYIIPFLYSQPQEIIIEDEIDSYEFKFNIGSYDNSLLYLYKHSMSYIVLDNYYKDENELVCKITKNNLEENLILNNYQAVYYLQTIDNMGIMSFDLVSDITIKYKPIKKLKVYVCITNLVSNTVGQMAEIAYETRYNRKNIPCLTTDIFWLEFESDISNSTLKLGCYLKKTKVHDLRLYCNMEYNDTLHLKKINDDIVFNEINYKYIFIIIPTDNKESFTSVGYGTSIFLIYPNTLDFIIEEEKEEEEFLEMKYIKNRPDLSTNIKLNPDSNDLECEDYQRVKSCIVPISHFKGKESGYYETYYSSLSLIYLDAQPFNVILPPDNLIKILISSDDNREGIKIGNKGTLYFITEYTDYDNIFEYDIIEESKFNTKIKDQNGIEYNVGCNLWKDEDKKLKLFCNLNETMKYEHQSIKINKVTFSYFSHRYFNIYTIVIYNKDYIDVTRLDYNIPFLY